MVPGRFSWFFMVPGWFFMVPGRFSWFFMVPGWFFMVFLQNVSARTVSWPHDPILGRFWPSDADGGGGIMLKSECDCDLLYSWTNIYTFGYSLWGV